MEQSQGFEKPGQEHKVLRLHRCLYRFKLYKRLNQGCKESLDKLNFKQGQTNRCLLSRNGSIIYVLIYIGDLLIDYPEEITKKVDQEICEFFQMRKDLVMCLIIRTFKQNEKKLVF